MPAAWFLAPYETFLDPVGVPSRRPVVYEFLRQVAADGGKAAWTECLGDQAVVKVLAADTTLQAINAAAGVTRLPLSRLDDGVATLTAAQQTAIQNRLLGLGYTAAELNAAFPLGWNGPYTLRDVLRFALGRRLKPRWDVVAQAIVLDGPMQACEAPETVDVRVPDA